MILDGLTISRLLAGLQNVVGQQLRQVYQTGRTEFHLKFSRSTIAISISPSLPFITLGDKDVDSPSLETPFNIFLRRHLNGYFLTGLSQERLDRIVYITLEGRDSFGVAGKNTIVIELMGPGSNMIVLNAERRITSAFKEMITSRRTVSPGLAYYPPEQEGKINLDTSPSEVRDALSNSGEPLSKALKNIFAGVSRATAENIVGYLQLGEVSPASLEEEKLNELAAFLSRIGRDKSNPNLYTFDNGRSLEVSPIPLDFKGECIERPSPEAVNRALKSVGVEKEFDRRKRTLTKKLERTLSRVEKLLERLEIELASIDDYSEYRHFGELIVGNLYRLREKAETVEIEDWDTGETVLLSLDGRMTPSENAQRFFKLFDKSRRKEIQVKKRIGELQKERDYLEQLMEMIELSQSVSELATFNDELVAAGVLKLQDSGRKKKKKQPQTGPRVFEKYGFRYFVGKSNTQNDEITRSASKDDIWFHAHGIPGAHVILKKGGKSIPEEAIAYGALLAGMFSRGRLSGRVDIIYTQACNITKPKGAKPGMVLYRKIQTLTVELSQNRVNEL